MQLQPVQHRQGFLQTLRHLFNPTLIGTLLGIVLGVFGAKQWMPPVLIDTVGQVGGCYVPVSLLIVGFTAANFNFEEVVGEKKASAYAAIRLLILPCALLAVLRAVGGPDIMCVMGALSLVPAG